MPSGENLVTLAEAKEYLEIATGDTGLDAKLNTLITAVSAGVELWCDRDFPDADYVHYFNGRDSWRNGFLPLRHPAVNSVSRLATRPTVVLTVKNTATTTHQKAPGRFRGA